MTNLYIQTKKKRDLPSLKAVTKKDKIPNLVEKKDGKLTLISEEKTYYLYLDKQVEDYNFHKIYNFFVAFAKENKKSINVEIKSFVTPNLNEELVLQAIGEGTLFGSHQAIDYKTSKKESKSRSSVGETNYYLITSHKRTKEILNKAQLKLEAVNFARDLQDTPPNKLHAKEFA